VPSITFAEVAKEDGFLPDFDITPAFDLECTPINNSCFLSTLDFSTAADDTEQDQRD